jgi:hypothetical protein
MSQGEKGMNNYEALGMIDFELKQREIEVFRQKIKNMSSKELKQLMQELKNGQ